MSGFQSPITISNAIDRITRNEFLLPAFQREFVWNSDQIEKLFDSLMQGYPISSMLFWKVKGDTKSDFRFYQFLTKFVQYYHIHNETQSTHGVNDFHAILDGQQRLTALYIGLCGSYAYKEYRRSYDYSEWSYPTRHLYLNVTSINEADESDMKFRFNFLNKADTKEKDIHLDGDEKWFKVGTILSLHKNDNLDEFAEENDIKKEEKKILKRLERVIFNELHINYYEEDDQIPDKAVNIFVRINSGGTPLSFSDILFSIAIASWKNKDARTEINLLVDNIRGKGFNIDKDYILKAFLYLYHKEVRFRITSFNNDFIANIEDHWDGIRNAILNLFDLLKTFGLNTYTLTTNNATLPVLYYIYHRGIYQDFATKTGYDEDRKQIRKWLYTILVRRAFGGQADTVLTQARRAFADDVEKQKLFQITGFPATAINREIKKLTEVGDDYIDELLRTQINTQYSFPLLALLYPNLDYKNNAFHQDHLHPASKYPSLSEANKNEYGWQIYNSICNLQMLDANENMSKNQKDLNKWIEQETKKYDMKQFCESHLIPQEVSYKLVDFKEFIEARKVILRDKLKEILN